MNSFGHPGRVTASVIAKVSDFRTFLAVSALDEVGCTLPDSSLPFHLESKASAPLHGPRSAALAKDSAKLGWIVYVGRWVANTNSVEQVGNVQPQFELHPFAEGQVSLFH